MVIAKIAFRNLFRHRRRSLLTGLMMAGGCLLFSVFIGMVDGSYGLLIDMFTRDHTGHIQIHKKGYLDKPSIYKIIEDPEAVGEKIEMIPSVVSWAPRIYSPALAFAGRKTSGVRVMGVDPAREAETTRLLNKVKAGRFISEEPSDEIVIGERLSRVLKAGTGDEIALIAQGVDGSIANELFTVVGITGQTGSSFGGSTSYINIESARRFLSMPRGAHEIAVILTDQALAISTAKLISQSINLNGDIFDVDPWQVVEKQFYLAMQADIKGNWLTIIVFTIIIAIGVLNTVLMVILERTREFGVLKAIGTRPFQIFMLIILETAFLALLSIVPGAAGGIAANWLLSVYGITLPNPVDWGGFLFDTITAKITVRSILIPVAVIVFSALLVSIPPAIRAACIKPADALRSQ